MVSVSKYLSERRSTKSDMSPVSLRSALPSAKTQNRVSQVLQVQVPLNPLRKKSTAKDIGTPSAYSCITIFLLAFLSFAALTLLQKNNQFSSFFLQIPTLPRWLRNLRWTHQGSGTPKDPLMTPFPPFPHFTPVRQCRRRVPHAKVCQKLTNYLRTYIYDITWSIFLCHFSSRRSCKVSKLQSVEPVRIVIITHQWCQHKSRHRQPSQLRHRWGSSPQKDPDDNQAAQQGKTQSSGGEGGWGERK